MGIFLNTAWGLHTGRVPSLLWRMLKFACAVSGKATDLVQDYKLPTEV
jgi:hypothetical protein